MHALRRKVYGRRCFRRANKGEFSFVYSTGFDSCSSFGKFESMCFNLLLTLGALVMDLLSPDTVLLGRLPCSEGTPSWSGHCRALSTRRSWPSGPSTSSLLGCGRPEPWTSPAAPRIGEERSIRCLLLRVCPSVTAYPAFLNNTPVVAMGIPVIRGWCKRHGVSPQSYSCRCRSPQFWADPAPSSGRRQTCRA